MFAVKFYINSLLCFRILSFFFFFTIMDWDLLAKEKTSEAQTSCEKLRCFLPVPSCVPACENQAQHYREMQPLTSRSQVLTLPSHLLRGPLLLARQKLKEPCPAPSCTAETCVLALDILELCSVELQPCAPLHRRSITPRFCSSQLCQAVFDRNICFCTVHLLCRIRN